MTFNTLRENFQHAALAGAVYLPYAAKYGATFGAQDLLQQMAIIGGIFMALRIPIARQVPMFLTRALVVPLLMRGRRKDPELQAMVDEMLEKTGSGKTVTVKTYERGITNNAAAIGGEILVGRTLLDTMDREELKFVLGHELAHIESQDMSERYLFWPPFVDAITTGFAVAATALQVMTQGVSNMTDLAIMGGLIGASAAYYGMASGIRRYHSRLGEYRADANSLRLNGNFDAASSALGKLYRNSGQSLSSKPTRWETFRASHPLGTDRLDGLRRTQEAIDAERAAQPAPVV